MSQSRADQIKEFTTKYKFLGPVHPQHPMANIAEVYFANCLGTYIIIDFRNVKNDYEDLTNEMIAQMIEHIATVHTERRALLSKLHIMNEASKAYDSPEFREFLNLKKQRDDQAKNN